MLRSWGMLVLALIGVIFSVRFTQRAIPPTVQIENPAIAPLMVALGGSRGILSEILWWRISELQSNNRFAELLPMTDLLVTLDPANADAWVYNAWNLAYNISVFYRDPAECWTWVKRGILLLLRGVNTCPVEKAGPIFRQIGWFFEDKLGGHSDVNTAYYQAHIDELPVPTETDAFVATIQCTPDWKNPKFHALYWYTRAQRPFDTLRVTIMLLREGPYEALLPYFATLLRQQYNDFATIQQQQLLDVLHTLAAQYPAQPLPVQLLKEFDHD